MSPLLGCFALQRHELLDADEIALVHEISRAPAGIDVQLLPQHRGLVGIDHALAQRKVDQFASVIAHPAAPPSRQVGRIKERNQYKPLLRNVKS